MALQAPINISGVDVAYWKISSISTSYTGKLAQIYILGFLTEEIRDLGLENSFILENFVCKKDIFDSYFGTEDNLLNGAYSNPLQAAYAYLKDNIEQFKNATDI